jgi:hypothetical protein
MMRSAAALAVILAGCALPRDEGEQQVRLVVPAAESRQEWMLDYAPGGEAGDAALGEEEKLLVLIRGAQEARAQTGLRVETVRRWANVGEEVEAWVLVEGACSKERFEIEVEPAGEGVRVTGESRFELAGEQRKRVVFTSREPGEGSIRVTARKIKSCDEVRD